MSSRQSKIKYMTKEIMITHLDKLVDKQYIDEKNKTTIQFLGTGANDWRESHECNEICKDRCARVRKTGGKNIRRFCSLFIAPNTIIDFTGDTVKALHAYGIDKELIHNVIITHGHNDHFQPIEIMGFASSLSHPLTIYGNEMVKNNLDFVAQNTWDNSKRNFRAVNKRSNIQVKTVSPERSFLAGELKVTPVLANHMIDKTYSILEQQALNYILEFKGKTVFYGLDSSFVLPRSFNVLTRYQFDIAVFDATFGHKEIEPTLGHHNFSMLKKTIAQFRAANLLRKGAMVIANHISRRYVDPYEDIVCELRKENIILAYDGMIINF